MRYQVLVGPRINQHLGRLLLLRLFLASPRPRRLLSGTRQSLAEVFPPRLSRAAQVSGPPPPPSPVLGSQQHQVLGLGCHPIHSDPLQPQGPLLDPPPLSDLVLVLQLLLVRLRLQAEGLASLQRPPGPVLVDLGPWPVLEVLQGCRVEGVEGLGAFSPAAPRPHHPLVIAANGRCASDDVPGPGNSPFVEKQSRLLSAPTVLSINLLCDDAHGHVVSGLESGVVILTHLNKAKTRGGS